MARIRTIKPEFWTDEKLAECSVAARLLFIGIWNFCDDSGRMEFSPKRLKMQVYPGDSIDVAPLVEELKSHGLVIVYRIENRDFLCVPKFSKHQRIDKPTASKIPAPDQEYSQSVPRTLQESSANHLGTLAPEGNGMERNGRKTKPSPELTTSSGSDSPIRKKKNVKTTLPDGFGISDAVRKWAAGHGYTRLEERLEHFIGYAIANGKTYADWDQAFENAIRDDWAKLNSDARSGNGKMAPPADIFTNNPAIRMQAQLMGEA